MSSGANLFISFLRGFRTPGAPIRVILVYAGMLPCLVPQWPQIVQACISFRSRSDLVLDADHSLDFLGWQFPILLCRRASRFSDKTGASLFLPCSH